ncbi:hypothetical protein V8E53_012219 [Lactarius tabidus]
MWERRPGKYNRTRQPNYSRSFIDSSSDSNTSQPSSGTATDLSASSTSSSPTSRDPVATATIHKPLSPLPTIAIPPDSAPHNNPEPFDVIEHPLDARRNFSGVGILVVVRVVHTSDISQLNSSDPTDNTASHPASPVPPQGWRPLQQRGGGADS